MTKPGRRGPRIVLWIALVVNAALLAILLFGVLANGSATCPDGQDAGCKLAETAVSALAVIILVAVWALADVVLLIIWLVARSSARDPL